MENKQDKNLRSGALMSIEVEGRNPTEAIQKALDILKVSREEVKIKILFEEERGLFGMAGARPAKVKVTLLKQKRLDKQG